MTGALTCLKLVLKHHNTSSGLNGDLTIIYAKWREGRQLPDEIEFPDRREMALMPKKFLNGRSWQACQVQSMCWLSQRLGRIVICDFHLARRSMCSSLASIP